MSGPADQQIRFDDGAAYERGMGVWSRQVGPVFLDWIAPPAGLRWVDVGCGNGAFTDLLMSRCAPVELQAIDPSEEQLDFARKRVAGAHFQRGDAMALPFGDDAFDAAVMALVIFFVPDPARGLAEMVRVVRPGGLVAAYAWDIPGGGLPIEPVRAELRGRGVPSPLPPSADVSRMAALQALWMAAGLEQVESRVIAVQRVFEDFDDFWDAGMRVGALAATLAVLPERDVAQIRERVRASLRSDAAGRVTADAHANAIRGRAPDRR